MLDLEELKNSLSYDPDSGKFTWINVSKYHKEKLGTIAGTVVKGRNGRCYESIGINGKYYKSHRLAWLYIHEVEPTMIDHMNGDSLDNRILNLNEVNQFKNAQNHISKPKANGLPLGVSTCKNGFRARITENGKVHHLGVFDDTSAASNAYESARDNLHYAPSRML